MFLDAFRQREDERGAVIVNEPLRELLSFRRPRDSVAAAVRQAQLDALVRLVPVTVGSQLLAAGLIAGSLRGSVADVWLALWFGAMLAIGAARGTRALRVRSDPVYAERKPPNLIAIVRIIAVVAMLWLVPPVFWFEQADAEHQMMMGVVLIALMSAGTVSLGSVPQAVLVYLGILMIGGLVMTSHFTSSVHMVLMAILTLVLSIAAIANARRFIGHVRTQIELREQSEPAAATGCGKSMRRGGCATCRRRWRKPPVGRCPSSSAARPMRSSIRTARLCSSRPGSARSPAMPSAASPSGMSPSRCTTAVAGGRCRASR